MSAKRDHNRAWVRHARAYGATRVTIWFARGEYDDATKVEVGIRQALGTLAEHVEDFHVDAVGTHDGADVTGYLSEYVEPKAPRKAGTDEPERAPRRTPEEEVELAARIEERYQRALRRKRGWPMSWLPEVEWTERARAIGNAAAALVTLWFAFAFAGMVVGWFRGDWVQGVGLGTAAYAAVLLVGAAYGWHTRRAARA